MLMKRIRRWHWLVFCWCLGFLHMFNALTVNVCVQQGLLILKCLLDYTYLSRQTYRPFASALNHFSVQCLLDSIFLFHMLQCHQWVLMVFWTCNISEAIFLCQWCLHGYWMYYDAAHMFAFCVFSLLTTKLSIWFQTRGRHRKQINALCPSFTWLRPLMFKLHMLLLMPMMITTTRSLTFYLWKLRQPVWVVQIWDELSLLCCVQWPWARSLLQLAWLLGTSL
jgi:hypothetical protein